MIFIIKNYFYLLEITPFRDVRDVRDVEHEYCYRVETDDSYD